MAATTISRTGVSLTNDTGTAATPNGDGTLLNASWCSTFLDRIDALFSSALTIGGTLTVEGTGNAVVVSGTTAGNNTIAVTNSNTGSAAYAQVKISNSAGIALNLAGLSTTYASIAGYHYASAGHVEAQLAGGLSLAAYHASGELRFFSGGTTERARFTASGHLVLAELTTNPGTSDCAADAAVAVYTKADKLVFAYNNGGTMTYITLDLDGSDTTWAHSTSAP